MTELTYVPLEDDDDDSSGLTIHQGLRQQIIGEGELARDRYMERMKQAMILFKRLDLEQWTLIGDPTDRVKQYYSRNNSGNVHYVKVRGKINCSHPKRIITMERDYCWLDRRRKWDRDNFHSIIQNHEYECKGKGTVRVVACDIIMPWWAELAGAERSSVIGIQWDRYLIDNESGMFLFESLDEKQFFGLHIQRISPQMCYVTLITRVTTEGLLQSRLFKSCYLPILKDRLELYERVLEKWDIYYPDNGRIIR